MKLPKPRNIIAEKYVAGLSLFKSRRSPIKLSANESALGPSPKAVKSYSSIGKGFVRYPDSDGTYFRKVLAKKFKLKTDRIILGSGSDQIFELVCKLFLNKGDEVVVPEYSFIIYRIYSRMFGAKVIITLKNGKKITEKLDKADAHPYGSRPFVRNNYIKKFLTLTKNIISKKEVDRFLKNVQNLKKLKSGQLNKLNIEIRKSNLKKNTKKGIF